MRFLRPNAQVWCLAKGLTKTSYGPLAGQCCEKERKKENKDTRTRRHQRTRCLTGRNPKVRPQNRSDDVVVPVFKHAACCMLHVACCMLHAACCMLQSTPRAACEARPPVAPRHALRLFARQSGADGKCKTRA